MRGGGAPADGHWGHSAEGAAPSDPAAAQSTQMLITQW
jgi:hypothetical protein